jgi:hypothetical protein
MSCALCCLRLNRSYEWRLGKAGVTRQWRRDGVGVQRRWLNSGQLRGNDGAQPGRIFVLFYAPFLLTIARDLFYSGPLWCSPRASFGDPWFCRVLILLHVS